MRIDLTDSSAVTNLLFDILLNDIDCPKTPAVKNLICRAQPFVESALRDGWRPSEADLESIAIGESEERTAALAKIVNSFDRANIDQTLEEVFGRF